LGEYACVQLFMVGIDQFGMKYDWMFGYIYWHEIGMHETSMVGW